MKPSLLNKLGAASYAVWGLLHFRAAYGIYLLGAAQAPGLLQGRVFQGAWHLGLLAAAALGVALGLNWRGSRVGYWVNLGVVGVTDLGFILLLLLPGYVGWREGLIGPGFWLLGALLTSLGQWLPGAANSSRPQQHTSER